MILSTPFSVSGGQTLPFPGPNVSVAPPADLSPGRLPRYWSVEHDVALEVLLTLLYRCTECYPNGVAQ